jgi:predicted CopG family antitoxin
MNMETNVKQDYSMKMIRVDDDTHERLKEYGKFGESFQDILNRLMDIAEGKDKDKEKEKATKR